jgi:hypothetical protein
MQKMDNIGDQGLEAVVSIIEANGALIAALKEASEHLLMFKQ